MTNTTCKLSSKRAKSSAEYTCFKYTGKRNTTNVKYKKNKNCFKNMIRLSYLDGKEK
jgi:hypothetical protein